MNPHRVQVDLMKSEQKNKHMKRDLCSSDLNHIWLKSVLVRFLQTRLGPALWTMKLDVTVSPASPPTWQNKWWNLVESLMWRLVVLSVCAVLKICCEKRCDGLQSEQSRLRSVTLWLVLEDLLSPPPSLHLSLPMTLSEFKSLTKPEWSTLVMGGFLERG